MDLSLSLSLSLSLCVCGDPSIVFLERRNLERRPKVRCHHQYSSSGRPPITGRTLTHIHEGLVDGAGAGPRLCHPRVTTVYTSPNDSCLLVSLPVPPFPNEPFIMCVCVCVCVLYSSPAEFISSLCTTTHAPPSQNNTAQKRTKSISSHLIRTRISLALPPLQVRDVDRMCVMASSVSSPLLTPPPSRLSLSLAFHHILPSNPLLLSPWGASQETLDRDQDAFPV
ncbi:hypothetical protein LZ31DRAFT_352660 [Colletotrichum somersetense]|nr:hypothetical protein LZ31DRAFT_352660 [Colletotrichum somersetense]